MKVLESSKGSREGGLDVESTWGFEGGAVGSVVGG